MTVNLKEKISAKVDAEKRTSDGFGGQIKFDLASSSPVAVDLVGQRRKSVLGDPSVKNTQRSENLGIEMVSRRGWRDLPGE